MSEPQSTADLRILDEMCDEIERCGVPMLVGGLARFVRTERGKRVARMLEKLARELVEAKWGRTMDQEAAQRTLEIMQNNLNSERKMNHQLTTELQAATAPRT